MFHRHNKILLAAGITIAVIAAMAGPAGARPLEGEAASTPVPIDVTGDITWTYTNTPSWFTSGADKQTGKFHIDLTNVLNNIAAGNNSTYSITDNLNEASGTLCPETTTGSASASGSLPQPPTTQLSFLTVDIQLPSNPNVAVNISYIPFTETQTRVQTGDPSICTVGTFTYAHPDLMRPTCFDAQHAPTGITGVFNGTYPNGTVNLRCSGTYGTPGQTDSGSYSVTGTLTIRPACGSAAASQAGAHTTGQPMTSTPGSGNTGGLSVTITSAVALPPPQPANQEPLGAYFSIPRPGQQNAWQRFYDLTYTVTQGSTDVTRTAKVTNATVELDTANGSTLQQNIVNEGPNSDGKVLEIGCGLIQVQVTYSGGTTSTVASTPPPTNQIAYKFTLSAQDPANGDSGTSAAFTSQPVYALWKMPDSLPRYGPCGEAVHQAEGPGGDNWVSQSTYNWMDANRGLLPAINDTSFEHGMNLGPHLTHGTGNDMDLFHAYRNLAGAGHCSGTAYYGTLVQTVRNALAGNHGAKKQVTRWVNESRAWFDQLIPMAQVRYIVYAEGLARRCLRPSRLAVLRA